MGACAGAWGRFRAWRRRRSELLAAEQERALGREAARVREAFAASGEEPAAAGGMTVRWGLPDDEAKIAGLLELNGMPRWVAFEERFIVAAVGPDGRVLAALRYRAEEGRLLIGLLIADPRARERRLAAALYAGAADLAREAGAREVLARPASFAGGPCVSGGPLRDRYLPLGADGRPAPRVAPVEPPEGDWRRRLALWGAGGIPFFRAFRD